MTPDEVKTDLNREYWARDTWTLDEKEYSQFELKKGQFLYEIEVKLIGERK
jgi:hypothetical protein